MKKIICIFTAMLMLMAFSACGDKGDGANTSPTDVSPAPGDIEIPETTPVSEPQPVSELSICGIPVVSNSQLTGIGYQGVDYDNGVLTLDGVDMLGDYGSTSAIYFEGNLEIVVKGENQVTAENGAAAIQGAFTSDGSKSNLTLSGNGSLVLNAQNAWGLSCSGSVSVDGVTLDIMGTEGAIEGGNEKLTLGEGLILVGDSMHVTIGFED